MRTKILVAAIAFAMSGVAFATPGGEDDNTNCNGRGNPNSPCVPSGGGGGGGGNPRGPDAGPCVVGAGGPCNTGGTGVGVGIGVGIGGGATVDSRNTNTNLNANANTNNNTNSNANTNTNSNRNTNTNTNANLLVNTNTSSNSQSQAQTQSNHNSLENVGNSSSNSSATGGNASATGGNASATGGEGGAGGSATAGSNSSTQNSGNSASTLTINEASAPSKVTYKTVPNVGAPGLASAINNDLCIASASVGGSGVGFGVAIGLQYRDEDCVRRVNARQLYNMGYAKAAVILMAQDVNVRKALEDAGEVLPPVTIPTQPEAQIGQFPSVVVR